MTPVWYVLATNLAVASLFFAAWAFAQHRLESHRRTVRHLALGICMGIGAVASMVLSIELQPGVFLDLRSSLIAVAGFFGGPIGALAAGAIAGVYRFAAGGPGAVGGLTIIALAGAIGVVGNAFRRGRSPTKWGVLTLGVAVAAANLFAISLIPASIVGNAVAQFGPPLALLSLSATVLAGLFILQGSKLAKDRDLLRAGLTQAPDFHYIKNRVSRFTAVNQMVATYNGFTSPAEMVGKTDFDLVDAARAQELFEAEQEIMRTGLPMLDHEEKVVDASGEERWFCTSKVPLHNADGEIIGLAGVTRDITRQRRLEAELTDSRNLLTYAVGEMSDGLAMFDRTGTLVYCNERYRALFPLTSQVRLPGTHIRSILEAVVESGEQVNLGDPEKWIDDVVASMSVNGEEQVSLFDGKWLHIRTRPTLDGASMVVVSDVTTIKRTETELMALTGQLRVLATTDGLTGLVNRRAFDNALDEEVARSSRDHSPLSLILCDVDRFKVYNDDYGHPAGDECLRVVSRCLQGALLRQGDVAARYGGEEFAAILPNTDEDSAFVVAERVRKSLFELRIPHDNSEHGVVTLSAGISTYAAQAGPRSGEQLISRADTALYNAKAAGRNRVAGWRQRHEVRQLQRSH